MWWSKSAAWVCQLTVQKEHKWFVRRSWQSRYFAGHISDVDVVSWHPNGHYLATGSSDHTVRLWDLQTGQAQRVLVGHRSAVSTISCKTSSHVYERICSLSRFSSEIAKNVNFKIDCFKSDMKFSRKFMYRTPMVGDWEHFAKNLIGK